MVRAVCTSAQITRVNVCEFLLKCSTMSDERVYTVECCVAADIVHIAGVYTDEADAEKVRDAVSEGFHNGGDRHVQINERVVR